MIKNVNKKLFLLILIAQVLSFWITLQGIKSNFLPNPYLAIPFAVLIQGSTLAALLLFKSIRDNLFSVATLCILAMYLLGVSVSISTMYLRIYDSQNGDDHLREEYAMTVAAIDQKFQQLDKSMEVELATKRAALKEAEKLALAERTDGITSGKGGGRGDAWRLLEQEVARTRGQLEAVEDAQKPYRRQLAALKKKLGERQVPFGVLKKSKPPELQKIIDDLKDQFSPSAFATMGPYNTDAISFVDRGLEGDGTGMGRAFGALFGSSQQSPQARMSAILQLFISSLIEMLALVLSIARSVVNDDNTWSTKTAFNLANNIQKQKRELSTIDDPDLKRTMQEKIDSSKIEFKHSVNKVIHNQNVVDIEKSLETYAHRWLEYFGKNKNVNHIKNAIRYSTTLKRVVLQEKNDAALLHFLTTNDIVIRLEETGQEVFGLTDRGDHTYQRMIEIATPCSIVGKLWNKLRADPLLAQQDYINILGGK